ncbi:MAG: 4Fe-4S binding protein [Crenarchaeota archaeon]|nr:4Fe-4S binding protein [Thermoproteota archaeon]
MSNNEKNWKEVNIAAVCSKSSLSLPTGDWKTYTPIRDTEKCTTCLLCVLYCPDGAIHWDSKSGILEFDYSFCKGCGICAKECPAKAITMKLDQGEK